MQQNISFWAELSGEHAGEGFMPLTLTIILLTEVKLQNMKFSKIYLWAAIPGSNINLGPKTLLPVEYTRREQPTGLSAETVRLLVWKRQGVSPCRSALWEMPCLPVRGLINVAVIVFPKY